MTQTPSPGGSAMPTPATPATGTSTGSAMPPVAALTLEDALKKITELEQHAQNKTEEASRHGSKLTAAEKELAAYKAQEEAAKLASMSELEKTQKAAAALQEQHDALAAELLEARVLADVGRFAGKLNFIPSADLLAKLLDFDAIEFDDNAKPTNIEKLLEKLAKSEPGLVKPVSVPPAPGAPAIPAFAIGRPSIARPTSPIPGQRPSWDDVPWKT